MIAAQIVVAGKVWRAELEPLHAIRVTWDGKIVPGVEWDRQTLRCPRVESILGRSATLESLTLALREAIGASEVRP